MAYADHTFQDRNPLKRWLQRQRLETALRLLPAPPGAGQSVCDFGAGNGELSKLAHQTFPGVRVVCYEPAPGFLAEARENLSAWPAIEICSQAASLPAQAFDVVLCLEVFEHLPPQEMERAFDTLAAITRPQGTLVIGVPNEIGFAALYKGLFRMSRRYGAYDANWKTVKACVAGRPPEGRPTHMLAPDLRIYPDHAGFDHRVFQQQLARRFEITRVAASPVSGIFRRLMPEVYFVARIRR